MKVLEVHEYELTDSQVARLESNHICSVKVLDDINAPIIKRNDIVHFIMSEKINTRDFIIYRNYDKFFIRRILKITNKGVYVAGDNEKKYHLISKNDIMARAVGREHNTHYLSFTLKHRRRLYTFTKTRISYLRIKNRITDYDEEMNEITLKHLKANLNNNYKEEKVSKKDLKKLDDLDMFIDPNNYVIGQETQPKETNDDVYSNLDDNGEIVLPSIEEDIAKYDKMKEELEKEDDYPNFETFSSSAYEEK